MCNTALAEGLTEFIEGNSFLEKIFSHNISMSDKDRRRAFNPLHL